MGIDPEELLITVRPGAQGWTLLGPAASPIHFSSGAQAERSARQLARALARAGLEVIVEIFLRDGRLGGRLRFGRQGRGDTAATLRDLELA
ncbi:MAG TPA: hypothetical protein VHX64_09565 [Caulobacteraceae bacterium]|nr:hypothetical protein [Caulobacteraceae bacterium]